MAKLLPRSAHLIRHGITDRPSVFLSLCLSILSSSTSNFLIAGKTSNAARPTSFWPARQDLPLNLDASRVFYNLQCYIHMYTYCIYTHTHMTICILILYTCRTLVGHRLTRSTFCSPDLWAAFGPRFVLATAEGQSKSSAQFITRIRGLYLSHCPSPSTMKFDSSLEFPFHVEIMQVSSYFQWVFWRNGIWKRGNN